MTIGHSLAQLAGRLLRSVHAGDEKLAGVKEHHPPPNLQITSSAFAPGATMPERLVGAEGHSPELKWASVPPSAKELVLICEDPDAPLPKPFVHWIVRALAPDTSGLAEGASSPSKPPSLPAGAQQGKNTMLKDAYAGPAPPPGHGPHHYHFQLFALDRRLALEGSVGREALLEAMEGHVIGFGELIGVCENT